MVPEETGNALPSHIVGAVGVGSGRGGPDDAEDQETTRDMGGEPSGRAKPGERLAARRRGGRECARQSTPGWSRKSRDHCPGGRTSGFTCRSADVCSGAGLPWRLLWKCGWMSRLLEPFLAVVLLQTLARLRQGVWVRILLPSPPPRLLPEAMQGRSQLSDSAGVLLLLQGGEFLGQRLPDRPSHVCHAHGPWCSRNSVIARTSSCEDEF